jgi:hypothetical protein
MTPAMRPVDSDAISRIGYEAERAEVYVEFRTGRTYAYMHVPRPIYDAFEAAESKGGFVNGVLKPNYACREV